MTLLLSSAANLAVAQQIGMCRQMCNVEKTQCVKDIARPLWLESARMFLDKNITLWRNRLRQRQDKYQNEKNLATEQKQQCDHNYLQCTMACADPAANAVPQAPASAPLNPSLTPQ
jgi:hypothetical protein